jgi:hypothetical protein
MTFSVAQFREKADANQTGYFVPDTSRGGYRVAPDREWADGEARWQKWASNAARRAFVRSIKRDYPDIAEAFEREIEPLLQANGKPLKAWHVKWVLHEVDHLLRFSQAATQAGLDQQLAEEQAMLNHFPIGNPPALTAPRVDQRGEELLRPQSVKNEGAIEEVDFNKYELDPARKPDKGKEREDEVPVADPPPQELWVPKVQRQGGRREPLLGQNRAERQRSAKGKQAEEGLPRVDAPAQRQYSDKELERAEDALYKSFKAIERHAKNGTTRLALGDQDKALANLLLAKNRPDCKSLDAAIFKLTGERTSLAIHWDLPKKMRSWVELILNATSQGDAAQIELEMRLHLEQLDKDVALLEKALAKKPLLGRTAPNKALKQLKSMREQLESSEPWKRLGTHLQAMRSELPPEPLPIKVDPDIAEERLEKLGISLKKGEDAVALADEMVRAHNLLRDARLHDPKSSWASVFKAANPQQTRILDNYRNRRLDHIEEAVNRRSAGKAQIKFDRTKETYTIVTKDVGYGLQAFGQLRAIAWQIGGAPNLLAALGYDESDPSTG